MANTLNVYNNEVQEWGEIVNKPLLKKYVAENASPIKEVKIADVLGLQSELNKKAITDHKHDIAEINELQDQLDSKALSSEFRAFKASVENRKFNASEIEGLQNKLDEKAQIIHTHQWSQITSRPNSTATEIDTSVKNQHSHINKDLLDNLEDGNGVLIYNGNPLGESATKSVDTISDRDGIPLEARKEGLMVLVIEDETMYYLKGGIDNAFWQIFSTGAGGATNAATLPSNPYKKLVSTNVQGAIEELEVNKANLTDVYSKEEMKSVLENQDIDYYTLDNLPDLSGLHKHENVETLNQFSQFQGNLTWKGKTLGDLITEVYDKDLNGVIDLATTLEGLNATVGELNYMSGVTSNVQSQIDSLTSGTTYRGEFNTYQEMIDSINIPEKGDWVFILSDELKGAENTQYLHDGIEWVYGGGTTKTPDATGNSKGVIQLGGDLSHPNSTAHAPKLNQTGVLPGLYKSADIYIGEDGRITHATEGSNAYLNDEIVSEQEGWTSKKINDELVKLAPKIHTHDQLHDANMLGKIKLSEEVEPTNNQVIAYDALTGKASWKNPQGGKFLIGSKQLSGDVAIRAGSYITLMVDEIKNELVIGSTFRESGGQGVATGFEIRQSAEVKAGDSVRFSVETGFNKLMLHTLQMVNDANANSEIKLYSHSGENAFIEYNSNAEIFISDIVNIPIFDEDNSKQMHIEILNRGIEDATFTFRAKCTNLL